MKFCARAPNHCLNFLIITEFNITVWADCARIVNDQMVFGESDGYELTCYAQKDLQRL